MFKEPPITAFRRQQNIKNHIIRAKVARPIRPYPKSYQMGMKKCGNNCNARPCIKEGRDFQINETKWKVTKQLNCNSYNLVYGIFCKKENCQEVFIGETKRMLKQCLADHRGYVTNNVTSTPTGEYFNLPGHSLVDLSITVSEQRSWKKAEYRK